MAAARWKKSFSTWHAGATKCARRRSDHHHQDHAHRKRVRLFAAAPRADDAALLVPPAVVLAAAESAAPLARVAAAQLGLHPVLRDAEWRLFRSRRRQPDRRGLAMGHSV